MPLSAKQLFSLLDLHAPFSTCADVPELRAWHTDDELPLWQALEAAAGAPVEPPFFAIAWPSARVVARALLDGVIDVRGLRVADVGCGSGLVACAAQKAGARSAVAIDIDASATASAVELSRRNGVVVSGLTCDPLRDPSAVDADLVLCADLVSRQAHQAPFAAAVHAWRGRARVVLADSGRPFFDAQGLSPLWERTVSAHTRVDGEGPRRVRLFSS